MGTRTIDTRRHAVPRAAGGMTLVELVVALGMFSLMIAIGLGIIRSSTFSVAERQMKSERTLKKLIESLSTSATLTVNTATSTSPYERGPYASLTYYVPRDKDDTGTPISAVPDGVTDVPAYMKTAQTTDPRVLEYGLDPSVPETDADGVMIFRFERDRTISEQGEDLDLNGDGDINDAFDVGRIRMEYYLASDDQSIQPPRYITTIGDPNVVQRAGTGQWGMPITSDSTDPDDPSGRIFNLNGSVLEIRVWLLNVSRERIAHLVQNRAQVFLRNQ
jgi:hypothetical protein